MLRFAVHCPKLMRRLLGATLIVALAGCTGAREEIDPTASIPADYHQRHPIILADAPNRLDIFLVGASRRLDSRQIADLKGFAAEYRADGHGPITAMLPRIADQAAVQATLNEIRAVLGRSGVRGSLLAGRYAVADPHLASPIQLSFLKLQAKVGNRCGEWPDDLASGSDTIGWYNKTYYNFGCATQQDFAMQVADPRDLTRPRQEEPSDVNMRLRAVGNIEQGLDPGTAWRTGNTFISPVGAQ